MMWIHMILYLFIIKDQCECVHKSFCRFKYINRFEYFKILKSDLFFQINKHRRHIFYLQFRMNVFQIYFLIFYDDLSFCKAYIIIDFTCTFFVCTQLMSQVHSRCMLMIMHLIFEALRLVFLSFRLLLIIHHIVFKKIKFCSCTSYLEYVKTAGRL